MNSVQKQKLKKKKSSGASRSYRIRPNSVHTFPDNLVRLDTGQWEPAGHNTSTRAHFRHKFLLQGRHHFLYAENNNVVKSPVVYFPQVLFHKLAVFVEAMFPSHNSAVVHQPGVQLVPCHCITMLGHFKGDSSITASYLGNVAGSSTTSLTWKN